MSNEYTPEDTANSRIEKLKLIYSSSLLSDLFSIKREDINSDRNFSALRFNTNDFRIRSIEIWENNIESFFRIYHSEKISEEIKNGINQIQPLLRSSKYSSDFGMDFLDVSKTLYTFLKTETAIEAAKKNRTYAKESSYFGLELPDVDTVDDSIMGKTFTWREIIAINEDDSEENKLKISLCQMGVYLQRSEDGKSRYVGSAYGPGGILHRWLSHMNNGGNAKHLKIYVLANGYDRMQFTILETSSSQDGARMAESRWKAILGTQHDGAYDGFRLNSN